MMKAAAALLLLFLAQHVAASDFRNASWLMSSDQVRSAEGGDPLSATETNGSQQLVYKIFLNGQAGLLTYVFDGDRLVSASYRFRRDQDRSIYEIMKKSAVDQFGSPSVQKDTMVGWRLPRTEVALTSLPDTSCYLVYWEKNYFAKINGLASSENRTQQ